MMEPEGGGGGAEVGGRGEGGGDKPLLLKLLNLDWCSPFFGGFFATCVICSAAAGERISRLFGKVSACRSCIWGIEILRP